MGGWVPDPGSQKAASENSASQSWPAAGGNFDGFELKTQSEIAFLKVFGGINRIFFRLRRAILIKYVFYRN